MNLKPKQKYGNQNTDIAKKENAIQHWLYKIFLSFYGTLSFVADCLHVLVDSIAEACRLGWNDGIRAEEKGQAGFLFTLISPHNDGVDCLDLREIHPSGNGLFHDAHQLQCPRDHVHLLLLQHNGRQNAENCEEDEAFPHDNTNGKQISSFDFCLVKNFCLDVNSVSATRTTPLDNFCVTDTRHWSLFIPFADSTPPYTPHRLQFEVFITTDSYFLFYLTFILLSFRKKTIYYRAHWILQKYRSRRSRINFSNFKGEYYNTFMQIEHLGKFDFSDLNWSQHMCLCKIGIFGYSYVYSHPSVSVTIGAVLNSHGTKLRITLASLPSTEVSGSHFDNQSLSQPQAVLQLLPANLQEAWAKGEIGRIRKNTSKTSATVNDIVFDRRIFNTHPYCSTFQRMSRN